MRERMRERMRENMRENMRERMKRENERESRGKGTYEDEGGDGHLEGGVFGDVISPCALEEGTVHRGRGGHEDLGVGEEAGHHKEAQIELVHPPAVDADKLVG